MNDPALSELNPITRDQLRQCIIPVKEVPWSALRYAITMDLALWDGGKQVRKDETVYQVWGYGRGSGDVYFIEGYGSRTWRVEDLAKRLVATVQRYRAQRRHVVGLTAEVAMAGVKGSWPTALRSFFHDAGEPMPTFHELRRHSVKKEVRLGTAAAYWVDGHVRIVEGAPGAERLIEQMSRIGEYAVNRNVSIDWADAQADAFCPELYAPMRRSGPVHRHYLADGQALPVDGLDPRDFRSDEDLPPRDPLR